MKFMLFPYRNPNVQLTAEQRETIPPAVAAWCDEMDARGVRFTGHVLGPVGDSRTIRIRDGQKNVEAGPPSDGEAHIAGFNILECADLEEALDVAVKNPGATFGTLELRPIQE